MNDLAVLHVTSLPGGGVDRHVRDIARTSGHRHLFWHVAAGPGPGVIEVPGEKRFLPLEPLAHTHGSALQDWLKHRRVGIVHAHSASDAVRHRVSWAADALQVPYVATLHDILFLRRDGFEPGAPAQADPDWLARTGPFLREAAAVLAPSEYIAGLAREKAGLEVAIVPNGSIPDFGRDIARAPRSEFTARRPTHVVAVLGAIGPHKGSAVLEELAALLAGTDIAIVVIGYVDAQVVPGWRGDNLFIHGTYDDAEVAALMRAYGAELALFPNQVPESFSYALSDAWNSGLPVLVPPEGALAERVRRHGGGWLLPARFTARDVKAAIERLLAPGGGAEMSQVKSLLTAANDERIPRLDAMTRSLDALYDRFGIPSQAPLDAAEPRVQELLAKNLDGALFRQELVRLADEYRQLEEALEHERREAQKAREESKRWIAKLDADVKSVQADVAREVSERRALGQEIVQLRIHKDAFDLLPGIVRKWLLKRVLRARN